MLAATKVPTRTIPNAGVRVAALSYAEFRPVAADLDFMKQVSNNNAQRGSACNHGPPSTRSSWPQRP